MPLNTHLYGGSRPDLWAELPHAGRLLDIGAGQGDVATALREHRPALEVVSVEADERAAAVLRDRGGRVHCLDVERTPIPEPDHSFDCILFADVLEHLADPGAVLRRSRPLLAPGGYVVASIPNVAHYSAVLALLRQDWPQEDGGLFDRTHLRFFTRATIRTLFSEAGFRITRLRRKHALNRKWALIDAVSRGRLTDFGAVGFVVTAAVAD